jgi:2-oxo-4-hydroxy-4-carboxy--5-ureidoimidazoline (OHCU) decarboxylase
VEAEQPSDGVEVATAEQTAEPAELDDDWLEAIEYPDEAELNAEYDEKFEDPYEF